jgi:predicted Rossmann fold flavoprotein
VVGGGAAGIMAATTAAQRGRRVALLEKNQRPGLKILISGGGRCNLTTTRTGADLEAQYGERRGRFLRHALRSFQPAALRQLVEDEGVALHEEDLEKIFPVSRRARDVLDAVLRRMERAGARLVPQQPVRSVQRVEGGYEVRTPDRTWRAASLVLATGGLSYPKTGATGDGYGFVRSLGHTVTETVPALAPLSVDVPWLHELQGIVLQDTDLLVRDRDGRELRRRRRPILFTHRGLSGPGPMDLSGDVEERHGGCSLSFVFDVHHRREEVEQQWLAAGRENGRRGVESLLPREMPERLRRTLCQLARVEGQLATLSREGRKRLLDAFTNLTIPVERSLGFDHAEVTRGGVVLDEVDARTMHSKVSPGLYVCGELLDVDGPIGGFNFQAAFATGRLAGLHA